MSDDDLVRNGNGVAAQAIRTLKEAEGKKYKWGGKTIAGFDCSGFVAYVFKTLNPTKGDLFQTNVAGFMQSDLFEDVKTPQSGDIIIFPKTDNYVNHIGIVIDENTWVGSQSSTGVDFVKFSNRFWRTRPHYFRRYKYSSPQAISEYLKNLGVRYA